MLRRRLTASTATAAPSASIMAQRTISLPGWQTMASTRKDRSREGRDLERKARQIEKLPRPELLHDFQYPHHKTILSDQMLQSPVYEAELDTPSLFNPYPPSDFFVYMNAHDFSRTQYPQVPDVDHRKLSPRANPEEWKQHATSQEEYLRKHGIVPMMQHRVVGDVNLSVVFGDERGNRAVGRPDFKSKKHHHQLRREEKHNPVAALKRRNFWHTAHAGNFVELGELQHEPTLFIDSRDNNDGSLYTLYIVSPDYPYRTKPHNGFFLHSVIANIPAKGSGEVTTGDKVVEYIAPLPTEDAGTSRHVCLLFKQENGRVNLDGKEGTLPFDVRSNYILHSDLNVIAATMNSEPVSESMAKALTTLESNLPSEVRACTFLTTSWDIQVQEYYESIGRPEPCYTPDDCVDMVQYNALPLDYTEVSSRMRADGALQDDTVFEQKVRTTFGQNTATTHMKRSTLRSRDGKRIIRPKM